MLASALELTHDAIFGGKVRFWQPARGYRVNVDAVLVAAFAQGRARGTTLDLGAGVGAITLVLHHLGRTSHAILVERESELAALARQNMVEAGVAANVLCADLEIERLPQDLHGAADLVVCNPPFFDPDAARPSRDDPARRARFGKLEPFLASARLALAGKRASACFAYPSRSLEHLVDAARDQGLTLKRLRFVHADESKPARLCLVELRRARPGGLVIEPPLYEWKSTGVPTPELAELVTVGRASGRS